MDNNELKNKVVKSGTTILGIVCKDGIVMASDRQTTVGFTVANKNYPKIIKINDYLIVGMSGILSDAQLLTRLVRAELRLKELKSKRRPTVKEGASLFSSLIYQNIRKFSAIPGIVGIVIGGIDNNGETKLFSVEPSGAICEIEDYTAEGSGMLYVYGILEKGYRKDITTNEGIKLAVDAIKASTQRDIGSGYGIDVFVIDKKGIRHEVKEKIEPRYMREE